MSHTPKSKGRAKYGAPAANIATAHKLARIIYNMLKDKVEYVDLGEDYYNEQFKSRLVRNLKHKAKTLGFDLVPTKLVPTPA
jgi:transposase